MTKVYDPAAAVSFLRVRVPDLKEVNFDDSPRTNSRSEEAGP